MEEDLEANKYDVILCFFAQVRYTQQKTTNNIKIDTVLVHF